MPSRMGGTFGTNLRAFHMAVKVIAARRTLSGFIEAHSTGTFMNGTVWSKPQTLPSCTRKRSSGVLKTRHDRLRRELDQCAELDDAKQRLQRSAEKNDRECDGENQWDPAGRYVRFIRMNQAVDQN